MPQTTVRELMTEPVLTIAAEEAVADAATAMFEEEIKSVVVIDDDCRPTGVFTSTDVMHVVAEGADPDAATVGAYMTEEVVTATPDEPAAAVAGRMEDAGGHHVPVVDDEGSVQGILTASDCTGLLADQAADPASPSS